MVERESARVRKLCLVVREDRIDELFFTAKTRQQRQVDVSAGVRPTAARPSPRSRSTSSRGRRTTPGCRRRR